MAAPAWSNLYEPEAQPYTARNYPQNYGPDYNRRVGYAVMVNRSFYSSFWETYEEAEANAQSLNDRHHRIARLAMSQGNQPVLI
jgi:hypothetical protein